MKKGQIYDGVITQVDFPNKGQVITEDGLVMVKNGIPGQKVRFVINKKRGGKCEGRLLEVLEPSPLETQPAVCREFPDCGGCMYQTMDYDEQLKMKENQVKKLLDRAVKGYPSDPADTETGNARTDEEYLWEGIIPSPGQWAYRNKMEFSFGDAYKDGPLTLGLHKKGSNFDILDAGDCKIVHSDFTKILRCVHTYFMEYPQPYYRKTSHIGYLRHLLLRRSVSTGELLIHLVTTSQADPDLTPLVERLLDLQKSEPETGSLEGRIAGILHIVNDSLADVVQSDETRILYGQDYFYETVLGLQFKVSSFSFFQTNTLGAERLYGVARSYIGDTKDMTVYDLYSGTGTIAQMMAASAKKVIGVEIVEEAVAAAKENAQLNGLDNCEFIAGDVLKVLDEIEEKPDYIILDPPRDGIHPKALKKIIAYGVPNLVYISCKPTSLARDLEVLQEAGYRLKKVKCVDMFPNTVHVETVCLLSKLSSAKHHIEINVDMDELDLTSAEAKATYEEIRNWVQEKYGLHVTNLNIAQVKQKHGIIERENYNKPKSPDSKQPGCPEEKVKAIEDAMRHFQMI